MRCFGRRDAEAALDVDRHLAVHDRPGAQGQPQSFGKSQRLGIDQPGAEDRERARVHPADRVLQARVLHDALGDGAQKPGHRRGGPADC